MLQVVLLRDVFAYNETSYGLLMTFYGAGLLGTLRQYLFAKGVYLDVKLYVKLRQEISYC